MRSLNPIAILLGCLWVSTASAHAVIEPKSAIADTYQKLTIRITHGCDGSPTKEVRVEIPETLRGARPMPKAGWSLQTTIQKLATPYTSHGKTITEDVRAISWKDGSLPNEWFDEFSIQVKLPEQPGIIPIPVTQICESGKLEWTEVSTDSQKSLKSPAPLLEVLPAQIIDSEHHHH